MKGNYKTSDARAKAHAKRLAWLRDHPALVARLPSANDDVEDAHDAALDEAVKAMKFAKLYAPTAAPQTIRYSIRLSIAELRGERVHGRVPGIAPTLRKPEIPEAG